MEARVQGCVTCHGQQGQGTSDDYFPRIAGKPAGYLFNQLRAFRDGTRRYAPMNYLVAYLTDDYLREMAEYFAALRPPFRAPQPLALPANLVERGRTLVQNGDASRQIPACVACHGPNLTGMVPGIPGLVGLQPNYISAQLTRWRAGERRAAAPDCMHRIATRLSDPDIQAVSAWLGSLAAPSDPSPDPRNIVRMPIACGSQR
jgi:cytochrome c553